MRVGSGRPRRGNNHAILQINHLMEAKSIQHQQNLPHLPAFEVTGQVVGGEDKNNQHSVGEVRGALFTYTMRTFNIHGMNMERGHTGLRESLKDHSLHLS